jgi:hypothetical protein
MSRSIVATALVVHNPGSASVLGSNGQKPVAQSHALRGGPMQLFSRTGSSCPALHKTRHQNMALRDRVPDSDFRA